MSNLIHSISKTPPAPLADQTTTTLSYSPLSPENARIAHVQSHHHHHHQVRADKMPLPKTLRDGIYNLTLPLTNLIFGLS